MLKRNITYTDYDDETVTETFYFNITKVEIVELNVSEKEGLDEFIKKIVKSSDNKSLVEQFKRLILLAYGEKSEDGKRFIKNDDLREGFAQSAAFDALFMELATSEEAAAEFVKGIIPKDLAIEMANQTNTMPLPIGVPTIPTM
jgi:hypothetical protein